MDREHISTSNHTHGRWLLRRKILQSRIVHPLIWPNIRHPLSRAGLQTDSNGGEGGGRGGREGGLFEAWGSLWYRSRAILCPDPLQDPRADGLIHPLPSPISPVQLCWMLVLLPKPNIRSLSLPPAVSAPRAGFFLASPLCLRLRLRLRAPCLCRFPYRGSSKGEESKILGGATNFSGPNT